MKQPEHSAIIARAAKAALGPLGFQRKGRSRVWLGDRGYWLCVVEFQPSGFSKGSYLNTSAHWLWRPSDVLSFDYQLPAMRRPFVRFQDPEQFEAEARTLAALAASEVGRLDEHLSSFPDVAHTLLDRAEDIAEMPHKPSPEWAALDAAIAAGILGDVARARGLLDEASKGRVAQYLGDWLSEARDALQGDGFPAFIKATIDDVRAGYGFSAWTGGFLE